MTDPVPPGPPEPPPGMSRRAKVVAIAVLVVVLVVSAAAATWSLLRPDGPEDAVEAFQEARSCADAKEVMHPDFRATVDEEGCRYFDDFYDNYDYEYDMEDAQVDGDEATVVVHEKGTALNDENEDIDNDTEYELVEVDGEWLITGSTDVTEPEDE